MTTSSTALFLGYIQKTAASQGIPEENIFNILLRYLSAKAGKTANPGQDVSKIVEM